MHGAVVLVFGTVVVVSVSGVELVVEFTNDVDVSLVSEVSLVGGSDESVGASVDDEDGSTESTVALPAWA